MVWCGVPKALLPKGKGRDVYPRVQVNGRAACVAHTLCVVCVRWSSLLCHFVAAVGPVRLGGSYACPGCGALVALPSRPGVVWCGVVWCGVFRSGVLWGGVVWSGVACPQA